MPNSLLDVTAWVWMKGKSKAEQWTNECQIQLRKFHIQTKLRLCPRDTHTQMTERFNWNWIRWSMDAIAKQLNSQSFWQRTNTSSFHINRCQNHDTTQTKKSHPFMNRRFISIHSLSSTLSPLVGGHTREARSILECLIQAKACNSFVIDYITTSHSSFVCLLSYPRPCLVWCMFASYNWHNAKAL